MSELNKDKKLGWVWAVVVGGVILSLVLACIVGGLAGFFAGRMSARSATGSLRTILREQQLPNIQLPQPNMTPVTPNQARLQRLTGAAVVVEVTPGGPAEKAGLKVGDMINRVDGARLTGGVALADLIAQHKPGDVIVLTLGGQTGGTRTVDVTLGEHPDDATRAYLGVRYSQFSVPDPSDQSDTN